MNAKSLFRSILLLLGSAIAVSTLSACHTVRGIGSDVKDAGRGIEHTADRAAH